MRRIGVPIDHLREVGVMGEAIVRIFHNAMEGDAESAAKRAWNVLKATLSSDQALNEQSVSLVREQDCSSVRRLTESVDPL